jgi:hypothetical protein
MAEDNTANQTPNDPVDPINPTPADPVVDPDGPIPAPPPTDPNGITSSPTQFQYVEPATLSEPMNVQSGGYAASNGTANGSTLYLNNNRACLTAGDAFQAGLRTDNNWLYLDANKGVTGLVLSDQLFSFTSNGTGFVWTGGALGSMANLTDNQFSNNSYITKGYADSRLAGTLLAPANATAGQVLTYNGTVWGAANATGGGGGGNYTLPPATASTLGGVKQGANTTIAGDGTISVMFPSNLTGYIPKANWTGTNLANFTGLETSFGTAGVIQTGAVGVGNNGQIKLVGVSTADPSKYSQVLITVVGSSLSSYASTTDYGCITAATDSVKLFTNVSGNTTANLTIRSTGNLTFTETSGGFAYNNTTKALESLTDIAPGNLSYVNRKYADARYAPLGAGGGGLDTETANGLYQPKLANINTDSNIPLNCSHYQAVTGEVGFSGDGAEVFHGFVKNDTQNVFAIGASYGITGYKGRSQGYRIGSEVSVIADPASFSGQTEIASYLYDLSGTKTHAAKIKVYGDGLEISCQKETGETPTTMAQSAFGMNWKATGASQAPGEDPMQFQAVSLTPGDDLTRPRWSFGSAVVSDFMPEIIPLTGSRQLGADGLSSCVYTYSGTEDISLTLGAGPVETTLHVINLGNATITLLPQSGGGVGSVIGSKTLAKSGVGTGWKITKVNTQLPGGNIWLAQDTDADASGGGLTIEQTDAKYVPLSSPEQVTISTSGLTVDTGSSAGMFVSYDQMGFKDQMGGGFTCIQNAGMARLGGVPQNGLSDNSYMTFSDCNERYQSRSRAKARFSGVFLTPDGKTVTIVDGVVESIE